MGRFLVLAFATKTPGAELDRFRALLDRARSAGGVVVAFGASRVAFAFAEDALDAAFGLAATACDEGFAGGLADGELEGIDPQVRGLAWGPALASAERLADDARAGRIHVDRELAQSRRLAIASARGRVDPRGPYRADAAARVGRMVEPPLVGPGVVAGGTGELVVLRADPGAGGTRLLQELAKMVPRTLLVTPTGSSFEPLGSLRRAVVRAIARGMKTDLEGIEPLLAGEGIDKPTAVAIVRVLLDGDGRSAIAIDDAVLVDPASLESCVKAARRAPIDVFARLDATVALPSVLAVGTQREVELRPFTESDAEQITAGALSGRLDVAERGRWARRGGGLPLAIVESVAASLFTGDLTVRDGAFVAANERAGRGKVRTPAEWIARRARALLPEERTVLQLVALLGGEARTARMAKVLRVVAGGLNLGEILEDLVRTRWLVVPEEWSVALPSRTHRESLVILDEEAKGAMHSAIADVVESEEGTFGKVEAAWHAIASGQTARASRLLLDAARKAASSRFVGSTTQLIALARRADPSCEEPALDLLADALDTASDDGEDRDSEPPPTTTALRPSSTSYRPTSQRPKTPRAPEEIEEEPPSSKRIALRLGELARESLLAGDVAGLERWIDGLHATEQSPIFTERMRAMARLGRGDAGTAIALLRGLAPRIAGDLRLRSQTALALAVTLDAACRHDEALLEGLLALASAREGGDEFGERACLLLLAQIYEHTGRTGDAMRLRQRA